MLYKFKIIILGTLLLFLSSMLFSLQIVRDDAALREGPEVFFDAIVYLKKGASISLLKESSDGLWMSIKAGSKSGWVASAAVGESVKQKQPSFPQMGSSSPFGSSGLTQISAGSYVAAVKGFAEDYNHENSDKTVDIDSLLSMTDFSYDDYKKIRHQYKLKRMKNRKELSGKKVGMIDTQLRKIGLAVSMAVLSQGVVQDLPTTKKINVIANILNSQTKNYDTRIHCWILPSEKPAAYSAPAGYLFFSSGLLKALDNDKQLIAIIAHEIGHLALGHGMEDLLIEQTKNAATSAANKMDDMLRSMGSSEKVLNIAKDLRGEADRAFEGFKLVRDDKEELEADAFGIKLIRKNGISSKTMKKTLIKILKFAPINDFRYIHQLNERINKI